MQDTSFSWFNFLGTKFRNAALRQSECELGGWDKFIFLFWCWIQSLNLTKALPTPQFMATMAREDLSAPVSFYCISTTRKHLPPNNMWVGGKDPDAGKNWRWEKGMTEDEMAGWHHRLMDMSMTKLQELVMDREAWRAAVHGVAKSWTRPSGWTELNRCPTYTLLKNGQDKQVLKRG